MTLGFAMTGVQDKVASVYWTHNVESYGPAHLQQCLDEYESLTTDLGGSEARLSEFRGNEASIESLLPEWARDPCSGVGPMQEEFGSEGAHISADFRARPCEGDHVLRNALPVAGTNHAVHGVDKYCNEGLSHYKQFLMDLHQVERLLTRPGRRERFVATCLKGTLYERSIPSFESFSMTLHEPRWSFVVAFCQAVLPLIAVLRRAWNLEKYTSKEAGQVKEREDQKDSDGDYKFDPGRLTAVLKCPLFRIYHLMVIKVKQFGKKAAAWFESCPCHEGLFRECTTAWQRAQALKRDGIKSGTCPCMSCRGWEIVDGVFDRIMNDLNAAVTEALMKEISIRRSDGIVASPSDEDLAIVEADFQNALSSTMLAFNVKFAWAKQLPWLLMGMAHPVPARARHWAQVCRDKYTSVEEVRHHRKSIKFLKVGSVLRGQIDEFIERGVMGDLLKSQVYIFLFVPFSDRLIEREHLYLSDTARSQLGSKLGRAFVRNRAVLVSERCEQDSAYETLMAEQYSKLHSIREAISQCRFDRHPILTRPFEQSKKFGFKLAVARDTAWTMLEQLYYRQDLSLKYEDHRIAKNTDVRLKKEQQGAGKARIVKLPRSFEQLMSMNAFLHFKGVASRQGVVTAPVGVLDAFAKPLEEVLYGEGDEAVDIVLDQDDADEPPAKPQEQEMTQMIVQRTEDAIAKSRVCARIVHTGIGRMKSISTFVQHGQTKLECDDVAVTCHDELAGSSKDILVRDMVPRLCNAANASRTMILTDFESSVSLDVLMDSIHIWSSEGSQPSARYFLPTSADAQMVHTAVKTLLDVGALPRTEFVLDASVTDEPWATLFADGYVGWVEVAATDTRPHMKGLQLTVSAMSCLKSAAVSDKSRPLFTIRRELPLPDLTAFEMALVLKERQWTWSLFPKEISSRVDLVHDTSQDVGRWYTAGKTLIRDYLLCLLMCSDLRARYGTQAIPHYFKKPSNYKRILDGQPPIVDDPRPPQQRLAIEFEDADEKAPLGNKALALQDQEGAVEDEHEEVRNEFELSLEAECDELLAEVEAADPNVAPDDEVEELDGDADDAAEGEEGEGHEDLPPPQPSARRQQRRGPRLEKIQWGVFTIVKKKRAGW